MATYTLSFSNGSSSEHFSRRADALRALRREARRLRGGIRIERIEIADNGIEAGIYDQDNYCHASVRALCG